MQGRATEQNGRQFRALRNDALDPCLNGRKHRILKMQIVYRVRGDVEFGKQDQISALVTGKARQIERGIDIRLNVARAGQIGRASGRERVCQLGEIEVVGGPLKKKKK